MSSKAYLIKRIEELEAKKKALEAPQSVTTARFDADSTPDISNADKTPPEAPPSNGNGNPMPASLRGMSSLGITLHFLDGHASRDE